MDRRVTPPRRITSPIWGTYRRRFAAGFWPPRFGDLGEILGRILAAERFRDLSEILGRILAAEIPRDLGRISAAEIPKDLSRILAAEI